MRCNISSGTDTGLTTLRACKLAAMKNRHRRAAAGQGRLSAVHGPVRRAARHASGATRCGRGSRSTACSTVRASASRSTIPSRTPPEKCRYDACVELPAGLTCRSAPRPRLPAGDTPSPISRDGRVDRRGLGRVPAGILRRSRASRRSPRAIPSSTIRAARRSMRGPACSPASCACRVAELRSRNDRSHRSIGNPARCG